MKLIDKMNEFLADQQIFYVKLHNLHWYVSGKAFFTLHAKFEELYESAATTLDDVAERILALGGKPVASMKKALATATLDELNDAKISGDEAVKILLGDVKALLKSSNEARALAAESGDAATEDLFIGYIGEYEKLIWMLEAYSG